jgi:hypothetical protein
VIVAIIGLLSSLFSAAGKLFDWLYAVRLADAGRVAERLEALRGQVDAAQKAVETRMAIERERERLSGGVPDDDGFRRPDDE